jgi:hypothetical protein
MREIRNAFKILVWKPEGRRPLDYVVGMWTGVIGLRTGYSGRMVMNLQVP